MISHGTKNQDIIEEISVHDENNIKGFYGRYRWLSNFHICSVMYDGVIYPSSEAAYQAAKFAPEDRIPFLTYTPNEAKNAGKSATNLMYTMDEWEDVKFGIMEGILRDKFKRNPDMKIALIGTGTKYLEETNWWSDKYWGVHKDGNGQNRLGKLLMQIREDLNTVQFDV